MFGINPSEFIVLLVVAAVVLGPERLPEYAQQFARLIRELRRMAQGASAQVRSELGPEFDEIDWAKLDPRQYDPRRIVREALSDAWDPDDPLGLKAAEQADGVRIANHPGRGTGPDDGDRSTWDGEKPQSPGGPTTRPGASSDLSDGDGTSTHDGPGAVRRPPAFDPDAT